ncbi:TolC family protein [Saccharicrinis fermentans]|uniref:Outer membrane channel protein n=1 Tax=Saccharicrinis fermentans DSM 9555 = JCM 21142 TaxID=869213 RepID=W7XZ22_9BACT|nr:TolC family protein [Saccharicrinis fermentans]GAF03920.1 outer membrane channel protein [Saccharicrinis fermentans DSM 9555 = JCM 21142]
MKKIQLTIFILSLGFISMAQENLSLADAINKALKNNYSIHISKANQQVAEINNSWGAAGRYPYINLSASSNNANDFNDSEDFTRTQLIGDAKINWTIFDGFAVKINKQRFVELEEQSHQNTAIMVEGTIQSVVLAYYDALLQKKKLETFNEVMSLSEDRYQKVQIQKDLGNAVTYDLLQAQNAYLSDRSDYLLQEVTLKNALRDLNYLMAEKDNPAYTLTEDFSAITINYKLTELQEQMTNNNKTLQNQYIHQRILENAVAAAKSNFSPTLAFQGGAQYSSTHTRYDISATTDYNATNIYGNFTLSFNLFSGGSKKRALQIAKIDEEVGVIALEDMQHDLKNNLANLYEMFLVRKELLNVAQENLAAAKLNLQISQDKFNSGAINSFNYRDVQNIYLQASQLQLEAIYNYIDTHTSLLRMTGAIVQEYE